MKFNLFFAFSRETGKVLWESEQPGDNGADHRIHDPETERSVCPSRHVSVFMVKFQSLSKDPFLSLPFLEKDGCFWVKLIMQTYMTL